jgi:hypothetical protein
MILDERNEFCDATALNTGGAASYLIGDVIDLGDAPTTQDLNGGADTDMYLVIQVDTTATSGGSATGQFHLVSDAQAAIAVDGTATYHFSTKAFTVASLVGGLRVCAVALPMGAYERYLGILQTTATAAFTAGKVNAFLTRNPGKFLALPNAVGA